MASPLVPQLSDDPEVNRRLLAARGLTPEGTRIPFLNPPADPLAGEIRAPSVGREMLSGLRSMVPDTLATVASLVPAVGPLARGLRRLGPVAGPLARIAASEGGYDLGKLVTGQSQTPGVGAATQAVGEGLGAAVQGLRGLVSGTRAKNALPAQVADWLKKQNPALEGYASDAKGLAGMMYDQRAQNLVRQRYADSWNRVVGQAEGRMVNIPVADARTLKLTDTSVAGQDQAALAQIYRRHLGDPSIGAPEGFVSVDAEAALKAIIGKSKQLPGEFRRITDALDEAGLGDPVARAEYRAYMGLSDFFNKTKALRGGGYDVNKVKEGLASDKVDVLRRRDLGGLNDSPLSAANDVRMVPHDPLPPWIRHGIGVGLGVGASTAIGGPGGWHSLPGVAGGLMLGSKIPPQIPYRPATQGPLSQITPSGVAEALRLLLQANEPNE